MPIPDHVQISYSSDETARQAYTRQAAEDWHEFVAFRGRELAPGGRLVVLTVGLEPDGGSGFRAAFDAIVRTLCAVWSTTACSPPRRLRRMSIPSVGRDEKAFRAPFAPSGRFEGLSVEHLEMFNAEDRFWSQYRHDGDAAAFGANWAGVPSCFDLPDPCRRHSTAASPTPAPSSSSNGWKPRWPSTWPPLRSR